MAYIGNAPAIQSTEFREEFFPSSNQTAFITGGFHPSAVSVTRNGVLLSESDYTKGSDNVTITLANAAVSGDVVVIRGNRSLAQGVSVSESRVEYTWQSGDTVVQLNADVVPFYSDVYLNGVKLAAADYSINASTKQVSFTSAPAVGDVIAVVHKNETSALVALPLKDSSGAEILSESGSTVTLANVDTATIGSNALVVDSSGNVGVGTSLPDSSLEINKTSGLIVRADSTQLTDTNKAIRVRNNSDTDIFNVSYLGKVGIGTSSPSQSLHVENSGNYQLRLKGPASGFAEIGIDDNNRFRIYSNGAERMRIDSSGNLLVGTQTIVAKSTFYGTSGTGTNTAIGIIDDEGDKATLGLTTAGNLYIKAEDGEVYAIDSAGNSTVLSPHNFEMIPDGASESNAWAFYSRNGDVENDLGNTTYVNVDMMKVVRLVENLTGVKLLYTGTGTNADTNTVTQNIIESQQSQIDALTARIDALEATP